MDDVTVHFNSAKPAQLQAHAYTQGTEIHVAPAYSNPHTTEGIRAIGHELAHVVQQKQGRVRPTEGVPIGDDPALESEADKMAEKLVEIASKS